MPRRNIVGCEMRGLESERPTHNPIYYDYIYKATDTGNTYWNDGTAWILFSGAEKVEILRNKIFDPVYNTLLNVPIDPFVSRKREGYISPAMTADASLRQALRGLPHGGLYSYHYISTTDGYTSRFTTSAVESIGYFPNSSTFPLTRGRHTPKLRVRLRPTQASSVRLYIGFANSLLPQTNIPLGNADSGVLLGFHTASTKFSVFRNNGTGPMTTTPFLLNKDTVFRDYEISLTSNSVTVKLDNETLTYETFIPDNDALLYPYIQFQSAGTSSKSLDISKGYFVSDI